MKVAKSSKVKQKITAQIKKSVSKKTKTAKKAASLVLKRSKVVKKPVVKIKKTAPRKFSRLQNEDAQDIAIIDKSEKIVNITISDNPLDTYLSPHILDLSKARFIEKVKPTPDSIPAPYNDLPGGDILEKLYIFELLSFEQSEILNGLKKVSNSVSDTFKNTFQGVDFSPKLSLDSHKLDKKESIWEQTVVFDLAASFLSLGQLFTNFLSNFRTKKASEHDEEMHFTLKSEALPDEYDKLEELSEAYNSQILTELLEEKAETNATDFFESPRPTIEDFYSYKDQEFVRPRKWRLPTIQIINPRDFSVRAVVAFAIVAMLIILPVKLIGYVQTITQVKGEVLGETEQAVESLQLAQQQLFGFNFDRAGDYFSAANNHFNQAENQLDGAKSLLTTLAEKMPISNAYRSGTKLLSAGTHLSLAGGHLVKSIGAITATSSDETITEKIRQFNTENKLTLEEFKLAQNDIADVNINHIPEDNRDQFQELTSKLPAFIAGLEKVDSFSEFAVSFLGDKDLKRYLVVFQNDNELRASGGFMGSFALVDLQSGSIKNISIPSGGTYDMRAGLNYLLQSPKPMQLLTPRWEFQDANWWPDWPTSAKNVAWFYQKSNGPTIDGVIAINSDWMKELLRATGPIDLPEYKKTITADNFEDEVQQEVEVDRKDVKQPKKILSDLAPKLVERVFTIKPENVLSLASALNIGLSEKDILIYLTDPTLENFITQNGWDGKQAETNLDYLNVVATNIGGGKTDAVMTQNIIHRASIAEDGSVIDTILIQRSHGGPIDKIFTNQANRAYIRAYVPGGSQLIKASGFVGPLPEEFTKPESYLKEDARLQNENNAAVDAESGTKVYQENNKTVFANWLIVEPGQSREAILVYKLPFKAGKIKLDAALAKLGKQSVVDYGLLVQKQSGSSDDSLVSEVVYKNKPTFTYPEQAEITNGKTIFSQKLKTDLYYLLKF